MSKPKKPYATDSNERYGRSPMLIQLGYMKMKNKLQWYDSVDFCSPINPYHELDARGLLRAF